MENLRRRGFPANICVCCSVSFAYRIARDSPILNIVSQTMNTHTSPSRIQHEPWSSAGKSTSPRKHKMLRDVTLHDVISEHQAIYS